MLKVLNSLEIKLVFKDLEYRGPAARHKQSISISLSVVEFQEWQTLTSTSKTSLTPMLPSLQIGMHNAGPQKNKKTKTFLPDSSQVPTCLLTVSKVKQTIPSGGV